jgi:hypothetical protein
MQLKLGLFTTLSGIVRELQSGGGESVCSMWRDHNIFNEMGIPALTYGPSGIVGGGKFEMRIDAIADAARVHAMTALELCGEASPDA